jgi:hypothetical protein
LTWLGIGTRATPRPVADRYFDAALDLDVTPDGGPAELFTTAQDDARAAETVQGDYVVLAPGARHATKRWPPSHWRALATTIRKGGVQVVGLGLPHERHLLPGPHVIEAYGLPLRGMVALCRGARAVVSNDSGLLHVASAVATPLVALFGPTVKEFGFFPYRPAALSPLLPPRRPRLPAGPPSLPAGHRSCGCAGRPGGVDVSTRFSAQQSRLTEAMAESARGPRRNGLFALWLFLGSCGHLFPPNRVSERAHRRRLQALEKRLRSLLLPRPLERALRGGIQRLGGGTERSACIALRMLVTPVRETLGWDAAEAVARAAQLAESGDTRGGGRHRGDAEPGRVDRAVRSS